MIVKSEGQNGRGGKTAILLSPLQKHSLVPVQTASRKAVSDSHLSSVSRLKEEDRQHTTNQGYGKGENGCLPLFKQLPILSGSSLGENKGCTNGTSGSFP